MIKVEKIDKYFNRFRKNQIHVINNTSLEFESTGLVALLGPSGSGKTTLLNAIGGLDKVRKGNIYINGKKITKRFQSRVDKIRNLNIGYIFQDYKLVENMTVYDNVSIALKLIGIKDKKEIDKRVCYVLDKVGMLRYKSRPCNMLSGGERQRVGIARAIVKNPNIIIADEPTGNLDSKNSVEIMNIIKAISKDKLVILVSHEKQLVKFYASRIIELEDGKIVDDYINESENELDYQIVNNLYLKDYKNHLENNGINIYSNKKTNIKLDIVITDDNIYIKTKDDKRIEVIEDNSNIQMINDHYKNISKDDIKNYEFDFKNIINEPSKLKYTSIFSPITFITNGFKKVFDYSILKKILLIGFFLTGVFIMYSSASIAANLRVRDKDFVDKNKNYLIIDTKKVEVDKFYNLKNNLDIYDILPGDSIVKMNLKMDDYYQYSKLSLAIEGSLSNISMITKEDLIEGKLPENENEIVVDKMITDKLTKQIQSKMVGIDSYKKLLNREVEIANMPNMKIVGITDLESPSIYTNQSKFTNLLYHSKDVKEDIFTSTIEDYEYSANQVDDYNLYLDKIELKEGRFPTNDYEVIVNIDNKDTMKLNKEISNKVNERKLFVVGYYYSKDSLQGYLVNNNTINYELITKSKNIVIYPKDKEQTLNRVREEYKLNIKDTYEHSKNKYKEEKKDSIKASITSSIVVLIISLIEIFLMIRSSFLSRVKEVGIYRAIGVKKKDIYIMFSGEIIAITLLASTPGVIIFAYIASVISKIDYLDSLFVVNSLTIFSSIIFILLFNLLVGLIPIFNTIKKRPAEILSRTDI